MKKIRLTVLIAGMLAAMTLFSACSSEIPKATSFSEVIDREYTAEEALVESAAEIKELSGYQFLESKGEFMTFAKGQGDAGVSLAVFSTRNKKVVYAAESNSSEAVEITLHSGVPAFTVIKTQLTCADENCERTSVCELYDAMGNSVSKIQGATFAPIAFADTVLFNSTAYSIDEKNGALSKRADIPENLYVEDCSDWNDEYFYTYGSSINVYDRDFKHVYSWTLPSWGEYISKNMLNNGNVLVQYTKPLDNNSNEYDIYEMDSNTGEIKKFDIFTLVLDPKEKTEKSIDLNYVVNQVTTGDELIRASENNGMYRDDVDNIAYVYPIKEHLVDSSDASADIMLMGNDGKIQKSLKIIEDQKAMLPTCIGDNVYLVSTIYGLALIDIDGEILELINNTTLSTVGENLVSAGVIYTHDMEEVYSLYENEASIITYLGGTIFIKQGSESEYDVIAIRGKGQREILKYNGTDAVDVYFDELNESGCYAICNVTDGEYLYYNAAHKLLLNSKLRLDKVAADFGQGVTIYTTSSAEGATYYAFY